MSKPTRSSFTLRTTTIVAAAFAACAMVALPFASAGEPAPTDAVPPAEAVPAEAEAAPSEEATTTVFEKSGDAHSVTMGVTADGAALIKVTPGAGYKINELFPWKFVVGDVSHKKDEFTLDEKGAALSLAKAEAGVLRFSVCNDDTCLVEKVEITPAQ